MEFGDLLSALSEHLGGAIALEPVEGTVVLSVDDMKLSIIDADTAVSFVGVVGLPPPEDRLERLYKALLEANHLFTGTGGATFSIDSSTGEITLCRTIPYAVLTAESFCDALTVFVNTLESWIRLVADFRAAKEEELEDRGGLNTIGSGFLSV